ncbi:type II secretion system protein [Lysinibacillus sp. Ag94]|uniref:type II secretion system protein n=1 Tax=Lysinibacillus sp. Ag94 TaxID=2936682 RepID=UPI00200F73F7|nr:type II secretion system protein [Lysinibacillus sp. Ag94]UPW84301.1 type II secretion system GspH family protein [Lysinibacillus sp. Ag94]
MSKFHNERGMTLLEVLAVTVIVTLVSIILMSILTNGKTSSDKQMKSSVQLSDATYILKVVTKDTRKSTKIITKDLDDCTEYILSNNQNNQKYNYNFCRNNQTVERDNEIIAVNVLDFKIKDKRSHIIIDITMPNNKPFSSTIYFRGGS